MSKKRNISQSTLSPRKKRINTSSRSPKLHIAPSITEPCTVLSTYQNAVSRIEIVGEENAGRPATVHFCSRNPQGVYQKNRDRDSYTIINMTFPFSINGQEHQIIQEMNLKLPLTGTLKEVMELTDVCFDSLSNLRWFPRARNKDGHWKIIKELVPIQLPKENSLLDTTMGCLLQQMIESIQTAYVNGMPKRQAVQAWNKIFSLIWLHPLEQGKRRQCIVEEARSLMDFYSCKLIDCDQPNKSGNRNFDNDLGSGSFDSDVNYSENAMSKQYTESVYEKYERSVPKIVSKSPDIVICDEDCTMVPKCICVIEIKSELEKYHQNRAERQVIEYMLCHLHFQSKILGVLILSTGFKMYKAVKNRSTKRIRIIQSQFSIVDDSKEDNFRADNFKKFIHHLVVACEDISNDHFDIDIFLRKAISVKSSY
ncbi:Hypothetical predicted protein [Mytilus galloprovincialis]|uniref:Uncharacterized protein n=1 Tax=Mytilus galloprovincialis TaxID=29158 RepID=A0A8B6FT65_MYTGA|nr:Hypothetical predicted protein [Mytilus galloprovincialis]